MWGAQTKLEGVEKRKAGIGFTGPLSIAPQRISGLEGTLKVDQYSFSYDASSRNTPFQPLRIRIFGSRPWRQIHGLVQVHLEQT